MKYLIALSLTFFSSVAFAGEIRCNTPGGTVLIKVSDKEGYSMCHGSYGAIILKSKKSCYKAWEEEDVVFRASPAVVCFWDKRD